MRLTVLLLATAVWSCMNTDEQVAEVKFVSLVQAIGEEAGSLSLLQKSHNDSITIRYGFAPECQSKYPNKQVEDDITKIMRLWLKPLRDWDERPATDTIVDSFTYLQGTASEKHDPYDTGNLYRTLSGGGNGSELDITFYCENDRSFIFFAATPPQIHLYENASGNYSLSTLMHEVGHAFGLDDTYVEYELTESGKRVEAESKWWRYNRSDCGSEEMIGCQPLSIMNVDSWLVEDTNNPHLGDDDTAGIRWLYRYLVTGDVTCPLGFLNEINTGGCIPEDPLAFAMQQGDIDGTIELLAEQGLPINTPDKKGNTILHYAAQRAASHGAAFYHKGINVGASPDIENKVGITARELLFPALEKAIESGKLNIAERLISLAIKD